MEVIYSKLSNLLKRNRVDDDILDIYKDQDLAFNLDRKLNYDQITGYLLSYSEKFLVITNFDMDFLTTNGYFLVRRKDITKIDTFEPINQEFFRKALNLQNINLGLPIRLDLDRSIKEVISTLHQRLDSPIIGYSTEKINPNVYKIGIIENFNDDLKDQFLRLRTIGEDGNWEQIPSIIALDEITAIEWDTKYLNTLFKINQLQETDNHQAGNRELVVHNQLYQSL